MEAAKSLACLMLIAGMAPAMADEPGGPDQVPVVWHAPACKYERLGIVTIETGTRVHEGTQDSRLPPVRSASALARLSAAAQAKGGDIVILRSHQGIYFTHGSRQSKGPVFLRLRGAVIALQDEEACTLATVSAGELDLRLRSRRPDNVTSEQAYSDDPAAAPASSDERETDLACRLESTTGSKMPTRVCRTQAQTPEERDVGRKYLERVQQPVVEGSSPDAW